MTLIQTLILAAVLVHPQLAYADLPAIAPTLEQISYCESGWNQYTKNGNILISKTHDLGIFQINRAWKKKAEEMGFDITEPIGNTSMAIWIAEHEGLRSWTCYHGGDTS